MDFPWLIICVLFTGLCIGTAIILAEIKNKKIIQEEKEAQAAYQKIVAEKSRRVLRKRTTPISRKNVLPDDYLVLDFETTGLDPVNDDIIEVAMVRVVNRKPSEWYTRLIKPRAVLTEKVSSITGITYDMVKNKPYIETVIQEILDFIGNSPILGHNVDFDIKFLAANSPVAITNDTIDNLDYSRCNIFGLPHYRLNDVAMHLGVENTQHHRALNDCLVTQKCFEILREQNEAQKAK